MIYRRLLLLALIFVPASASAFMEIPFCPLGGPPGWFNRMTDNHHNYRYPPGFYPMAYPPAYQAYPGYQQPYMVPADQAGKPGLVNEADVPKH
jgi:hypothetical protein